MSPTSHPSAPKSVTFYVSPWTKTRWRIFWSLTNESSSILEATFNCINDFLIYFQLTWITLACKKKFPRINFQYPVSIHPGKYEYETHFFPSRPDFPKLYDKSLKIKKMGCLYVVFMLKLINKINVLYTWCVSQGIFFTLMSNFKL